MIKFFKARQKGIFNKTKRNHKMRNLICVIIIFSFACNQPTEKPPTTPYVMVLGVAQDAGCPQMNCKKECCKQAWENSDLKRTTSCLAIVDP